MLKKSKSKSLGLEVKIFLLKVDMIAHQISPTNTYIQQPIITSITHPFTTLLASLPSTYLCHLIHLHLLEAIQPRGVKHSLK